jgi:SAM-dependent methyltransferase
VTAQRGIRVTRDRHVVGLIPLEGYRNFEFQDGDHLAVVAETLPQAVTYDSCVNVRLPSGDVLRVPRIWENCTFGEYQIPTHLVRATGSECGDFESVGESHLENLKRFMTLEATHDVLEIGCGVGKDALQMMTPRQVASYLGIDVIQDSIVWCTNNLTKSDPRFRFEHFDAHHELYNPLGLKKTTDFAVPCEDSSIDRVIINSVFTHLFEDEVSHYLSEMFRVLRPGGLVYATVNLYSNDVAATARRARQMYDRRHGASGRVKDRPMTFEFEHSEGCYVEFERPRTGAVAYTREALDRMFSESGLALVDGHLPGSWSRHLRQAGWLNEVALLTKPHHDGI